MNGFVLPSSHRRDVKMTCSFLVLRPGPSTTKSVIVEVGLTPQPHIGKSCITMINITERIITLGIICLPLGRIYSAILRLVLSFYCRDTHRNVDHLGEDYDCVSIMSENGPEVCILIILPLACI